MRLNEIHLEGFGRLVGVTLPFASGFNLVFGPNEAGKSTLQQALLALLYGFFDEGRVTRGKRAVSEAFQPWDENASYAGSLTYVLDTGQAFRVSRSFGPEPTTSLFTYPEELDVSDRFERASDGRLFFADSQLGMSKEVFENICFVRQGQLVSLGKSATAITETLMRIMTSASADATMTDATTLLQTALTQKIGSRRAWTKPLSRAVEQLSRLEEERSELARARRELFSHVSELNQSEERLQELDIERQRLRCLRAVAEQHLLIRKQSTVMEVEEEIARIAAQMAELEGWAEFRADLRDELVRLMARRKRLQEECSALEPLAAKSQSQLKAVQAEIADAKARADALEDARYVQVDALGRLRDLANQLDQAEVSYRTAQERLSGRQMALGKLEERFNDEREALGDLPRLGHAGLVALRQQLVNSRQRVDSAATAVSAAETEWSGVGMSDEEYAKLEQTVQRLTSGEQTVPTRKGCAPLAALRAALRSASATTQPPVELAILAQVTPIHAHRMHSHAELESAQAALSKAEREAREQLGGLIEEYPDDEAFSRLTQLLEDHRRSAAEVEQRRQVVAEARQEAASAHDRYESLSGLLKAELEELGLDASDLHAALHGFSSQCERRSQLEREEASLDRLGLQAEALMRDVEDLEADQSALADTEARICELLEDAHIECVPETIQQAVSKFETAVKNQRRWKKLREEHKAADARRQAVLSGPGPDDLAHLLANVEEGLAAMLGEHPEWEGLKAERSQQEYESEIRAADEDWMLERDRRHQLRDRVESASGWRHPAEIDEDVSEAKASIERLERFGNALELALSELEEANAEFKRQFAPELERMMSDGLKRVTQGRYTDVCVSPSTLDVSLMAPEVGHAVGLVLLSKGTCDLVYLMLRVAMARLMSRAEERLPLLFDDPLVQCDRTRQEQTLGFLAQLAEETQLLLFTKDEWTKSWFEANCRDSSAHALHVLG